MTKEEVVEELQYIHDGLVACDLSYEALEIAIKTLSADVVEVVRCKDCDHRIDRECQIFDMLMNDDDYCSYGERRSDGEIH